MSSGRQRTAASGSTESCEVLVIGRGIAGLAAAYELQAAGATVHVVGPATGLMASTMASAAAEGVVSLRGQIATTSPLFAAKMAGHRVLPAWLAGLESISGIAIPRVFDRIVEPWFDDEGERLMCRQLERGQPLTQAQAHRLGGAELRRDLDSPAAPPWLAAAGGAFAYLGDGWFDPRAVLLALEAAVEGRGGRITDGTVIGLGYQADRWLVRMATRMAGPRTESAQEVVIAAGLGSDPLLRGLGARFPCLTPVHGATVLRPAATTAAGVVTVQPPEILRFGKVHAVGAAGGKGWWRIGSSSRVTSMSEPVPDDAQISNDISPLLSVASHRLGLASDGMDRRLAAGATGPGYLSGVRTRTSDRYPAVGRLELADRRSVLVILGLYKNGLQLAPLLGPWLLHELISMRPGVYHLDCHRASPVPEPFLPAGRR